MTENSTPPASGSASVPPTDGAFGDAPPGINGFGLLGALLAALPVVETPEDAPENEYSYSSELLSNGSVSGLGAPHTPEDEA